MFTCMHSKLFKKKELATSEVILMLLVCYGTTALGNNSDFDGVYQKIRSTTHFSPF